MGRQRARRAGVREMHVWAEAEWISGRCEDAVGFHIISGAGENRMRISKGLGRGENRAVNERRSRWDQTSTVGADAAGKRTEKSNPVKPEIRSRPPEAQLVHVGEAGAGDPVPEIGSIAIEGRRVAEERRKFSAVPLPGIA